MSWPPVRRSRAARERQRFVLDAAAASGHDGAPECGVVRLNPPCAQCHLPESFWTHHVDAGHPYQEDNDV